MLTLTLDLQMRPVVGGGVELACRDLPGFRVYASSPEDALEDAKREIARACKYLREQETGGEPGRASGEIPAPGAGSGSTSEVLPEGKNNEGAASVNPGGGETGSWSADGADGEEILRDALVLGHVDSEPSLTQRRLSMILNLSLGSVNQILKRLVRKGYIHTRRTSGRSLAYTLTPKGFRERSRLILSYTRRTVSFFATVRTLLNDELARLRDEAGVSEVSIAGTGELAEAAYLSAEEQGLVVTAFYDPGQVGTARMGVPVMWPIPEADAGADAIVVVSVPQEGEDAPSRDHTTAFRHRVYLTDLLSAHMISYARRIQEDA